MGIAVISAYVLFYTLSLFIFYMLHVCSRRAIPFRVAFTPYHRFVGFMLWVVALLVLLLGIVDQATSANDKHPSYFPLSVFGLVVILLGAALIFLSSPSSRHGHAVVLSVDAILGVL